MNKIARQDRAVRAELFSETAARIDLPPSLVEKDFWVSWVLKQLFSMKEFRDRLLFKGGTSLSKVFGVINRFSEDIDLAVDYSAFGFTGARDPKQSGLSKTKRGGLLADMLLQCQRYIAGEFLEALQRRCADLLGPRTGWDLAIDPNDPNIARFRYPEAVPQRLSYVASQVVLELGTHAEFIPRGHFAIRSFAAREFPGAFDDPDVQVTALLAKRTFWEKITILHAEYHRPPEKQLPGRYSRHYYDVAMMAHAPLKAEVLDDPGLLAQVVLHKQAFYPAAWAQYGLAVPGTIRVAPAGHRMAALAADYRNMAVMIFGQPPPFEWISETLTTLEREVNALG